MGHRGIPTRMIAAAFALAAFSVAVLSGMWVSNPTVYVLKLALTSSFVCYIMGYVIGSVGERLMYAQIQEYEAKNPVPDVDAEIASALQQSGRHAREFVGDDASDIAGVVGDIHTANQENRSHAA